MEPVDLARVDAAIACIKQTNNVPQEEAFAMFLELLAQEHNIELPLGQIKVETVKTSIKQNNIEDGAE